MPQRKSSEELRELYRDEYVSSYKEKNIRRIERILSHLSLRPDAKVVDIACGNGMLLDLFMGPFIFLFTMGRSVFSGAIVAGVYSVAGMVGFLMGTARGRHGFQVIRLKSCRY